MPNEPGVAGEPPAASRQRAVFLSYASEDSGAAQRICERLRAAGIEVWFDRASFVRVMPGTPRFAGKSRRARYSSRSSANAHARIEGYFRFEWKLAVDRSHFLAPDQPFLLPVVIDGTPHTDERIPERFRELQWTRLTGGETTPAFVESVQRLAAEAIEIAPPHPAASPAFPAEQAHSQTKSRLLRTIVWALTVVMLMSVRGYYASNWSARQTRAPAASGASRLSRGLTPWSVRSSC